jgi:hypothetical protein
MIDVHLSFADTVTAMQRNQFLARLRASLSPSMELADRDGRSCVRCADARDRPQALISVQARATPIMKELGLKDDHVTWSTQPANDISL